MRIGNTVLKHGLILAPMAGFSDRAMRLVCKEWGAEYTVSEMISAKAVLFNDKKTFSLAKIGEDEGAVALQLFGSDAECIARAAEILSVGKNGYSAPCAIDINMGCPVRKVFSNGEGSALMSDPDGIFKIVRAVVERTALPCTVKIRAGIDASSLNAKECALAAEAAGATAVAVHGRTRAEMYAGRANRQIIADVKKSLHIPVIANGDITSAAEALDMLRVTGADGIMIGRGAIGNPFIFSEITAALEGRAYTAPDVNVRVDTALAELRCAIEDKGERTAVNEARKRIAMYLRSFKGAAGIRAEINRASSYSEVETALQRAL